MDLNGPAGLAGRAGTCRSRMGSNRLVGLAGLAGDVQVLQEPRPSREGRATVLATLSVCLSAWLAANGGSGKIGQISPEHPLAAKGGCDLAKRVEREFW